MLFSCCLCAPQIGAYFGAVVCAMDVDGDSYSDVVLVSSPMYTDGDREGIIFICTITEKVFKVSHPIILSSTLAYTSLYEKRI